MRIETKAKLDYLKGTKSAIADALVEKGQTVSSTDTFRSYADKVRAIKGGGGGLESGIYFKPSVVPPPTKYKHRRFQLNGKLYAIWYNSTGNGYGNRLSRWDGSAWVSVLSSQLGTMDSTSWGACEYNGKMHFSDGKSHWVFDGETFSASTNFPGNVNLATPVIWQGKMVVYVTETGNLYEWDETNSSWVMMAHWADNTYTSYYLLSYNDILYAFRSNKLYMYTNGVLTEVASASYVESWRILNGKAYGFDARNREAYSIDLTTYVETKYTIPYGTTVNSVIPNDLSLGYLTGSNGNNYMAFFDVTVVEDES